MDRILTYTVQPDEENMLLLDFLRSKGFSRGILSSMKPYKGAIQLNGERGFGKSILHAGDFLRIHIPETESSENILPVKMDLSILYEDEDLLVINKPADMPVHPSIGNYDNTLANGAAWYFREKGQTFIYRCINRLDRDTTGALILAKNPYSGADLNYTDDDLDSYSTIWDGEITDTDKKDHKRVVEALKNISEGTDLETYMDVDNILKYMAVHTFVLNDDSLSGTMSHNYYLYEYNGKLNILPWDYNLSFGGMSMGGGMGGQSSGATSVINDAIDTPFSITSFFDALLENEEYLEQYHEYLNELVEKYVNGGEFEKTYERIRSQIDDLVGNDPTAFYSYEEYEEAANMLIEVVQLRAKSVSGQLAGTIPSTDEGQQQDSSNLIDGSDIDLSVMGSFSGGGGGNEGQGKDNGFAGTPQPFDAGDVSPISEEKADLQDSNQDSVK